jgi:hypothetical protein
MPKSRGRRSQRGGKKPIRRSPVPQSRPNLMLRDARQIIGLTDPLQAEVWASGWLGQAWLNAGMGNREAEHQLCVELSGRACGVPSPHGLAAVAALSRVAPASEAGLLTEAISLLSETQPLPPWRIAEKPDWTATAAWRAVNVWDTERALLIDYDGPHPHTLMAHVYETGGLYIGTLAVLEPGAVGRWDEMRGDDEVPMPVTEQPVTDVLTELADAMRTTDISWPRQDDEHFVANRALAWSRCRDYLPTDWSDPVSLPESERRRLIDEFAASSGHDKVTRSLAEMFLDYGEERIRRGPLCWSPDEVMLYLTDWLPRKGILDADQRKVLPDVLRRWLTFALTQRGVDPRWITPVAEAVDTHLREFRNSFDDHAAWGPAKQIAATLSARGVDLTDHQAVENAMHELNAERLAKLISEE